MNPLLPLLALLAAPPQAVAPPIPPPPIAAALGITPLSLIDAAITQGRLEAAAEIIRRAPLAADDPELLLRQAELALASGRSGEAMGGFLALIDQPQTTARAWQGLGLVRLARGDAPAAAEALDKALAADPGLARAHIARGVAADEQQQWPRADAAYAAALALAPNNALALANRGWSRLLRGLAAPAEADLAAALAATPPEAPSNSRIANNLRLARALQGHYDQAFSGSAPEQLAADLNMAGFAAMARGEDKIAAAYFRRALQRNPYYDKLAAANLAWLEARTGER